MGKGACRSSEHGPGTSRSPGVLPCPYQSAQAPAVLAEDVPHHIPRPAAWELELSSSRMNSRTAPAPARESVVIKPCSKPQGSCLRSGKPLWLTGR